MARKKTIGELYRQYFYENGEHLKGAKFVEAYKKLVIDALDKEFVILDDDNYQLTPPSEKTVKNLQRFQERIDDRIYTYVTNLSGQEKQEALESDVVACVKPGKQKMECSKLNKVELFGYAKKTMTDHQKLTFRLASAFAVHKPSISAGDERKNCAEELVDIAKDIKSHKPGFFTYLFRRGTYDRKMDEYNDLKGKMEAAINRVYYPYEKEKYFSDKAFSFLRIREDDPRMDPDAAYTKLMADGKNLIPGIEYTSVYFSKEADAAREKNRVEFEQIRRDLEEPEEENDKKPVEAVKEDTLEKTSVQEDEKVAMGPDPAD